MRMWTALCVAMYFFGTRAEIIQTPSLVVREDEKATLKCRQNNGHNSMYWYQQQPGKGMQLIYYSYDANQKQEGDIPAGFQANRPSRDEFHLDILSVKLNHSAVYFCASTRETNERLFFGSGTKLTVIEKDAAIIPPAVAIFSPSKQEIQEKSKATLVCLASGFYPDHLTLGWMVNGVKRTQGVGTDESSTRNGSTYSLTSRLRIPAWEWFNPFNRFECVARFFQNETMQSMHKFISGDAGCALTEESYLRYGNSLKLTYLILCGKALVYAVLVSGLVWTAKTGGKLSRE